jgi:hypothetical protein
VEGLKYRANGLSRNFLAKLYIFVRFSLFENASRNLLSSFFAALYTKYLFNMMAQEVIEKKHRISKTHFAIMLDCIISSTILKGWSGIMLYISLREGWTLKEAVIR